MSDFLIQERVEKTDMICVVSVRAFELPPGFIVQESLAHNYVLSTRAVEYFKDFAFCDCLLRIYGIDFFCFAMSDKGLKVMLFIFYLFHDAFSSWTVQCRMDGR
jgi:hypothetical protein